MSGIYRIVFALTKTGSNGAPLQRAKHIFETSCIMMYHRCAAASATHNYTHLQMEVETLVAHTHIAYRAIGTVDLGRGRWMRFHGVCVGGHTPVLVNTVTS